MLDSIYAIQAYLQASGISIDVILALFFSLISLIGAGYLIAQHINKEERDATNQFDWDN